MAGNSKIYPCFDIKTGDYILFGSDKNGNPMEWLVLRNYGEKILVISRYCVDNMAFGDNQFYSMSSVASFLKGFVNRFNEEEERGYGKALFVLMDQS